MRTRDRLAGMLWISCFALQGCGDALQPPAPDADRIAEVPASAKTSDRYTLLPDLGVYSQASDANAAGQVVGNWVSATGRVQAVVWRNGVGTALGALEQSDGLESLANAISPDGHIVGMGRGVTGRLTAMMWFGGLVTNLGVDGAFSEATDINPSGVIVGNRYDDEGASHAFRRRDGVVEDLGAMGLTTAAGINARGDVVGGFGTFGENRCSHPYILTGSDVVDIVAGTDLCGLATGISASGDVVGYLTIQPDPTAGPESHAFLWRRGRLIDLGTFGGRNAFARDVGADGTVVGDVQLRDDRVVPFVWRDGVVRFPGDGTTGTADGVSPSGVVVGQREAHAVVWGR